MTRAISVPYITNSLYADDDLARPFLAANLRIGDYEVQELALIDSGADVCVLPRHTGMRLGAIWEEQDEVHGLSGLTENLESRNITVKVTVGSLPTLEVPFAWTNSDDIPVILGQSGFFSLLDICFFRSKGEIALRLSN